MRHEIVRPLKVLALALAAGALAACASIGLGGKKADNRDSTLIDSAGATTVNRYLWSASLETLDFLPVFKADPIAGLVLTDWYSNPESPNEQFKVSVYILDTALRADALRVTVFKQTRDDKGQWADAAVNPATGREIENAILTRARQLRLNQIED